LKEGTAMIGLGFVLVFILTSTAATQTVAMPPHWHKPCMQAWKNYKEKSGHKAFAMSPVRTAMMVNCGVAWSAGSQKQAEQAALNYCSNKSKSTVCYIIDSQ
jgi:hypothetical protein